MINGKAHLFDLQAQICKTLADANRIMILHELRSGEKSVGQLVTSLGLPQSNVSHHLGILREKSIVLTRRQGTTIYYRLADERIGAACDLVRDVLRGNLIRGEELARSPAFRAIIDGRIEPQPGD
jgi:DNA-binding transcriptional ArsR family regulator